MQLFDLVRILRVIDRYVPFKIFRPHRRSVQNDLYTGILDIPGIDHPGAFTRRRRDRQSQDLVGCIFLIPGKVQPQPVIKETDIETGFRRFDQFRLQVCQRDRTGGRCPFYIIDNSVNTISSQQAVRIGIVTYFRIRSSQLCQGQPFRYIHFIRTEHIRNHPTQSDRRIEERTVLVRQSRRPVIAGSHIQEDPVLIAQLGKTVQGVHRFLTDIMTRCRCFAVADRKEIGYRQQACRHGV